MQAHPYEKIRRHVNTVDSSTMDRKFKFWARMAAIVFSVQAFIFLIMATAGFIFFYPKEERRLDFSLVLLRMGFPNSAPVDPEKSPPRMPNYNWHWKSARQLEGDAEGESSWWGSQDGEFRFASYFQDGMILQRDSPGPEIWGFGEAKQAVKVSFNNQEFPTTVSDNGQWRIRLPVTAAGGPYIIQASSTIKGSPVAVRIRSVLFGDVWLCSGQSNMEFHVEWMFNASLELALASSYSSTIRFMEIQASESPSPRSEPLLQQVWSSPNSVTVKEFSGLCWAFGRRLQDQLQIPIGLIGSYYGGTPIRAWSDPDVNKQCKESRTRDNGRHRMFRAPGDDSVLWNAMISPLLPLEIKGTIWYQGEADADGDFDGYLCMFPAMIESWRQHFRRPNMPFGFVQLGDRDQELGTGWPTVRWHQTADTGLVPNDILKNVFMAIAMDLPDSESPLGSIHPRYKEEIAQRLSDGALATVYGISRSFQGPHPVALSHEKSVLLISFADGPITLRGNTSEFEVCCGDRKSGASQYTYSDWPDCQAWDPVPISESTYNSVSLDVAACKKQVLFVRYAWKTTPCLYLQCPIYGAVTMLPAGPFVMPIEGS